MAGIRVFWLGWLLAVLLTTGTAAAEQARLIVQFRIAVADPARPEFVDALSTRGGVRLTFVRPLSGDAYLYAVEQSAGASAVAEAVARLSQSTDIAFVELEQVFQAQGR